MFQYVVLDYAFITFGFWVPGTWLNNCFTLLSVVVITEVIQKEQTIIEIRIGPLKK